MERHQRNPYIYGAPIYEDQQFFNRIELLRELTIPDSRAYYLKGNRRVGKTSLLRRVERQLLATLDCFPVYVDISVGESLSDFARIFQRAVKEGTQKLGLPPIVFENRENVFKAISVWIEYSKLHGRKNCFILLDESEKFLQLSDQELKKLHRAVLKRDPNLTLVITATSKLQELYKKEIDGDYFLSSFITKYIGCLNLEDIEPLVRQDHHLNNAEKVSVDAMIIAEIIRYSGLHPYLVQRLSYNLFESENASLRPLTSKDLVLDESLRHIIKMDFDHLDADHQKILLQFTWEQSISPDHFKGHPEPKVNSILVELEQLGFLRSTGDQYYLGNYFLAQWLEEQQPPVPPIKNGLLEANDGETGNNGDKQAIMLQKPDDLPVSQPITLPILNTSAIEKALNDGDYASAVDLLDGYFGNEPTPQYSTLKQTVEHHLNQGSMPPPAILQALKLLINKLKKQ